jgi:hypothetical protein
MIIHALSSDNVTQAICTATTTTALIIKKNDPGYVWYPNIPTMVYAIIIDITDNVGRQII